MKEGRREEDNNGFGAHTTKFLAIYIIINVIIAKFIERKLCIKCSRFSHCSLDDGPNIFDLSMHDDGGEP